MDSASVLVVGGAGYIGSVLVARLLDLGYAVRVLDSCVWNNANALINVADHPLFEMYRADMRDRKVLERAMLGTDHVVLLAGLVGDPITRKYPRESLSVNVDGVRSVISAALQRGVERLVFASTCSNYGMLPDGAVADELTSLSPLSNYAKHKVQIEQDLLSMDDRYPTSVCVLRFATAFGLSSRMRLDLTVSHFASDAVRDGRLEVYDADTWRPYCHVSDLALAVSMVLTAPQELMRGEVFNVGSKNNHYTKRMIADLIREIRPDVEVVMGGGTQDARNYRVDFSKARSILGFSPVYRVDKHLELLITAMERGVVPMDEASRLRMGNFELPQVDG